MDLPEAVKWRAGRPRPAAVLRETSMKKLALLVLVVFLSLHGLMAQSVSSLLQGGTQTQTPTPASGDPLGRDTPRGSVVGFLQAAQTGSSKTAADYLQMTAARRQSQGAVTVDKLKKLMDRAFVGTVQRLSQRPEGGPEFGSSDQQTIGTFSVGDAEVPVVLVRVVDPSSGKIWLFSSETLSKVPELFDNLEAHQVESKLPRSLVQNTFLGMPLWQWLALLASIPLAIAIGWAVVLLLMIPRRLWLKFRSRPNLRPYKNASTPLLVSFSALAHRVLASYFGLPLLTRLYYHRIINVLVTASFFWFLLRAVSITMQRLRMRAVSAGRIGTGTLMVLGERLLTALVAIVAILATLAILGFNLTTVLAGVGIGGIAIAFAAQKTLENLFGGISVLADEVIRVGDSCRFGDRVGTVEDISLRSTRIRTVERTELSIPNGVLATMNIENLTRRDKILFNPTLGMRYETSADQLRYILAEIRRMLYEHPKVESDSARIRFASFDSSALSLEIFSYVLTREMAEFTAIREDLLLRIIDIVEKSGSGFAFPSQTLYLSRDSGLDKEKTAAAEQQVEQWRDQHKLPFPDFAPGDKSAFRASIVYPEPDSAVGKEQKIL
jgi:MscS family membrane protein